MPKESEPKAEMQELARLAAPIAKNARLRSIDLISIDANRADRSGDVDASELQLKGGHTIQHRLIPESEESSARLFVDVTFSLKLETSENSEIATIRATLGLSYEMSRGMPEEAKDLLPAFAQTNSLVHVWPYYRELVQSTAWRMGLPPFALPLFQLGGPRAAKSPKAPETPA